MTEQPTSDALPPSAREELDYWEEELDLTGKTADVLRVRLDPERRIQEFPPFLLDPILPMVRGHFGLEGPATCLEIGPGPLSTLAYGVDAGLLDLTAVDVLANEYATLLERKGIGDFPVATVQGSGETLDEQFEPESFHVAYVRNALDHTDDAPRSLANLVRCLHHDGALVLQHHLREGTNRDWSDSHHWDLDFEGGELVAYGRDGARHDLTKALDLELVYMSYRSQLLDGWIDLFFRKR